jgi:hypothetical protein
LHDFSENDIGTVDYSDCYWGTNSCIRHSGDGVFDGNNGQHTIDINGKALPSNVCALFITVSA